MNLRIFSRSKSKDGSERSNSGAAAQALSPSSEVYGSAGTEDADAVTIDPRSADGSDAPGSDAPGSDGLADARPAVDATTDPTEAGSADGAEPKGAAAAAPNRPRPALRRPTLRSTELVPRVAIEDVSLSIDAGQFAAKAVVGHPLKVEADIFVDGHDQVAAVVQLRAPSGATREVVMQRGDNDRWHAELEFHAIGAHEVQILAWVDEYESWHREVGKKHAAAQVIALELREGLLWLQKVCASDAGSGPEEARSRARGILKKLLQELEHSSDQNALRTTLMSEQVRELAALCAPRAFLSRLAAPLPVWVDRPLAAFGAWYELMPRSMSDDVSRHGTFDDVIRKLPYVREMGFDVLYFPPIHPIGKTHRKGRNNSLNAEPGEPGSPYAIGSEAGGHEALHPELGSLEDFERLLTACREHGLEVAMDFAIQCSPDHPWIREHPEFFQWRPDGTIRYAENPPKRYEDIVNVDFYGAGAADLWKALRDVVLFWASRGVRIFRVDNPHTKPLPFWQWMIAAVRQRFPDAMFLSEAFTRPKMMRRLAKVGFSQSYTYFTWRNDKASLREYMEELSGGQMPLIMRPNFFVNTPDINPRFLQTGGRAAHRIRLFLAATLSPSYGMFSGFELCEATPVPGKEDYLDSEKYQLRAWDWDREGHIREDIAWVNGLRRAWSVMQRIDNISFYNAWNEQVLYFGKRSADGSEFLLFAVTLDPWHEQGCSFEVPLWELGLPDHASVEAEDLVTGDRFQWHGKNQQMLLTPDHRPYMAWRIIGPA